MKKTLHRRSLLLCLLVAACDVSLPPPRVAELCGVSLLDTVEWISHDEGMFSVRLPRNFVGPTHGGFDSFVGVWKSGAASVSYDWGSHSNDLSRENQPYAEEIVYCDATPIGATRLAMIQMGPNENWGNRVVAAHWADIEPGFYFGKELLSFFATLDNDTHLAEFLTILSTVRIKDPSSRSEWPGEMTGLVICGTVDEPAPCVSEKESVTGTDSR